MSKPEIKPEKSNEEEADEQPLKVEFTPVTEEGAIYSKRYIRVKIQHMSTSLPVYINAFTHKS